jgi:hypothetical protein
MQAPATDVAPATDHAAHMQAPAPAPAPDQATHISPTGHGCHDWGRGRW